MRALALSLIAAAVLALLCPPWEYRLVRYRGSLSPHEIGRVGAGYHSVFSPPPLPDEEGAVRREGPAVAWGRLGLTVAALLLPAMALWCRREQRLPGP